MLLIIPQPTQYLTIFFSERQQGLSFWLPFQTAAGTVTTLYKGNKTYIYEQYAWLTFILPHAAAYYL